MRIIRLLPAMMLVLLIVALPTFAGNRRYAEILLDDWVEEAELLDYIVFYSVVELIEENHLVSYYFELEPGCYYFVAEGGEYTEDIDMYILDEDGYEIASDIYENNNPNLQIKIPHSMRIEIEIIPRSFYGQEYEDYYCFVAARNIEDYQDSLNRTAVADPDEIILYWIDWAEDAGYEIIYTDIGSLSRDSSDLYEFDFEPGYYHIFAESLYDADDIDLYIWDEIDRELARDTWSDHYPICDFEIRQPESVAIEIVPDEYAVGNATEYCIVIAVERVGEILDSDIPELPDQEIPVTDDADWDFIYGLLDDYMEMVLDCGYKMIFDQIEIIKLNETQTIWITLGRGNYIVYGQGGMRIADLDLCVYDENGYVVAEDTMENKEPICEFSIHHSASFEIEIKPYQMMGDWEEGYYILIIVRD